MSYKPNYDLLRRVRDAILLEPTRFNMYHAATQFENSCDTMGCIAGWTCFLASGESHIGKIATFFDFTLRVDYRFGDNRYSCIDWASIEPKAIELLDIPRHIAKMLFTLGMEKRQQQYDAGLAAKLAPLQDLMCNILIAGTLAYAEAAARAIDIVIAELQRFYPEQIIPAEPEEEPAPEPVPDEEEVLA